MEAHAQAHRGETAGDRMKPRRPVTKPRQAMSARQVDRVEIAVDQVLRGIQLSRSVLRDMESQLTRLLASLRRSERR